MKQQTITGSTDSNGLFTAKNPYIHPCGKVKMYCRYKEPCSCFKHDEFKNAHPPLFCYNENNDLVKGVEGLEVKGPVWQYKCDPECVYEWDGCLDNSPEGYIAIATTRQVYIAVQPTGKAEPELIKGNNYILDKDFNVSCEVTLVDYGKVYATVKNSDGTGRGWQTMKNRLTSTPLPEAQPLEGVKTEEEIAKEIRIKYFGEDSVIQMWDTELDTVLKEAYNAQFATDAGEGNKQLLTDCQEMLMNLIALNHVPDEVCPDMNDMISRIDDALTAPSTHSSSEMVEGKLIELVNYLDDYGILDNAADAKQQALEAIKLFI